MMKCVRILLVAATVAISSCTARDVNGVETWTKLVLAPWLPGELPVSLSPAKTGQEVRIAALVSTGPQERNSCLTIRFDRSQFTEQFLSQLLASPPTRGDFAPFTSNGVEVVLGENHVFVNVYPGVVLLLRPDLAYAKGARAFASNEPVGRVEWVEGSVGLSGHVGDLGKFKNFVVAPVSKDISIQRSDVTVQKDGTVSGVGRPVSQADLPKKLPPRRAAGNEKSVRCAP
jgi:hypothetical protein